MWNDQSGDGQPWILDSARALAGEGKSWRRPRGLFTSGIATLSDVAQIFGLGPGSLVFHLRSGGSARLDAIMVIVFLGVVAVDATMVIVPDNDPPADAMQSLSQKNSTAASRELLCA